MKIPERRVILDFNSRAPGYQLGERDSEEPRVANSSLTTISRSLFVHCHFQAIETRVERLLSGALASFGWCLRLSLWLLRLFSSLSLLSFFCLLCPVFLEVFLRACLWHTSMLPHFLQDLAPADLPLMRYLRHSRRNCTWLPSKRSARFC